MYSSLPIHFMDLQKFKAGFPIGVIPEDIQVKIAACIPDSEVHETPHGTALSVRGLIAFCEAIKRYWSPATPKAEEMIQFALNIQPHLNS